MNALQQQKQDLKQSLQQEITGLRAEKEQTAASTAAQIQACFLPFPPRLLASIAADAHSAADECMTDVFNGLGTVVCSSCT